MKFFFKKIITYFLRGFIFITPLAVTFFVFVYFVETINEWVEATQLKGIFILFFLITVVFIVTLFGYIGSLYLIQPLGTALENVIKKLPLINFIYTSLKDVLSALVLEKKKFDKPVFVQMTADNSILKPGFITQEDLSLFDNKNYIAVYFPHSYAISGQVFIVDKKHILPSDIGGTEMMKFIISGGVTGFHSENLEK